MKNRESLIVHVEVQNVRHIKECIAALDRAANGEFKESDKVHLHGMRTIMSGLQRKIEGGRYIRERMPTLGDKYPIQIEA